MNIHTKHTGVAQWWDSNAVWKWGASKCVCVRERDSVSFNHIVCTRITIYLACLWSLSW